MSESRFVYEVEFTREYADREDTELRIGIYETEEEARTVVERLKSKPGFCDYPQGFEIHSFRLGLTGWEEGFITKFGPPPKDALGEAFDVPAWLDESE